MQSFETPTGEVRTFTDHPGGNADVLGVDGDTLRIRPETRDSSQAWFYWNLGVESPVAQRLRVELDGNFVSPRGPAVRRAAEPWRWLGDREDDSSFTYEFDASERVRFALAPAYQVGDFRATCERVDALDPELLTTSEGGREVPLVRVDGPEGVDGGSAPTRHVVVTCRHHACEAPASYVLEGLLEAATVGALDGLTLHAVPFVDVDGVERGDQGKHRAPHDHNRDYVEGNALTDDIGPIYRSTAAVMHYVDGLRSRGRFVAGLDLHCPFKWGGDNDRPFVVESPEDHDETVAALVDALADATAEAALSFDPEPGVGIHQFDGQSGQIDTFRAFAARRGAALATTLEMPYVGTEDDPVTPDSARAFGRHLADALARALGE